MPIPPDVQGSRTRWSAVSDLARLRWPTASRLKGPAALREADPAVRQAALLFTAAGVIGLITDFAPPHGLTASVAIDSFNLLVGLTFLTPLARRVSRRASVGFALLAFANIAMSNSQGAIPTPTLGIWFILVFVWVGSWHGRGVSVLLSPFATVAYLLPLYLGAPAPKGAVGAVLLVIPVGILAGEVIATNAQSARRAAQDLATANVTDDLTGVGNRRLGNQLLDTLQVGDALAILDLDHFKHVNDTYGHARGDEVLHDLGEFLRRSIRDTDEVARMGGEEFMVVIRRPSNGVAMTIAQRLLADWRVLSPEVTLSAGVAIHGCDRSPSVTYGRADAALYGAKQAGRDRAISSDSSLECREAGVTTRL